MKRALCFALFSIALWGQVPQPSPFNGGGGAAGGAVGGASSLVSDNNQPTCGSSVDGSVKPCSGAVLNTPQSHGAAGNGSTDDTAAIQAWVNSAIVSNVGNTASCQTGTFLLTSTITIQNVTNFVMAGNGNQCKFTWGGNNSSPMFTLSDVANSELREFTVSTTASNFLAEVVRTENGAGSTVSPTHNSFRRLVMQGNNGGIGICFRQSAAGAGGDNNNDFSTYDNNLCANYTIAGFTIEGTQSGGDVFIENECDSFGDAPYCVSGGVSAGTKAYFNWIGGFIAQATQEDFFLGTSVGGDTTTIIGVHSETSNRAIVEEGPTGALSGLYVSGYSFYSNGLNADGMAVILENPGPIEIHDSKFGSDYTKAVKIHWSYVGGGSSPSLNITGTTVYGSLSTRATVFDNLQPTLVTGSAAQTADATFATLDSINGLRTISAPGANTVADAYQAWNITTASSGNQQYSPALHLQGQGWETTGGGASQAVDMRIYATPVQQLVHPYGQLVVDASVAGGSYNQLMILDHANGKMEVSNPNSQTSPAYTFIGATGTGWGTIGGYLIAISSNLAYAAFGPTYWGVQKDVQIAWTAGSAYNGAQQTTLHQASSGVVGFGTSTNNLLGSWSALNGTLGGTSSAALYATATNCSNAASPAVCGSAAAGAVAIPTGVTSVTLVVNTTAVTANSRITLLSDDSLTIAATTCNSTLATLVGGLAVTARTPGASFTITYNGTIATNPLCVSYSLIN